MKFKFEILANSKEDDDYSLIKNYGYDKNQKGGAGYHEMFRGTKEECLERRKELKNGSRTDKNNARRTRQVKS